MKATVAGTTAFGTPVTATEDVPPLSDEAFKLEATLTKVASLGGGTVLNEMQLTHYNDSADYTLEDEQATEDNFYFGYFTNGVKHWRTNQPVASKDFWRLYKINVHLATQDGLVLKSDDTKSTYTEAEAIAALAAYSSDSTKQNGYSVSIAADAGSKAVFKVELHNAETASSAYTATSLSATDLSAAALKVVTGGTTNELYFGMYIEGDRATADDSAVNGNFTVTVTPVHVSY